MSVVAQFSKDPSDTLDYGFEWSGWLEVGETLVSSTWDIPSGLTAGAASFTSTATTQWLASGTLGIEYTVTNHVLTSLGRVGDRSFTLLISQLSVPGYAGVTATDLITRALRLIGVVGAVDTPEAEDLEVGKIALDDFVDALGIERAALYAVARTVCPLSAGVQDYTIGLGGAFNIPRPTWIDRCSVRPDRTAAPVLEASIGRPMTIAEWQGTALKTSTGAWPTRIYYDFAASAGLGTISVYPVPESSLCDLVLYTPSAPTHFGDLTTPYTLPPGWSRMYRYNLALELADDYGVTASARVEKTAAQTLAAVKRANWRPTDASLDPAMPGLVGGGRFDLYTGE